MFLTNFSLFIIKKNKIVKGGINETIISEKKKIIVNFEASYFRNDLCKRQFLKMSERDL